MANFRIDFNGAPRTPETIVSEIDDLMAKFRERAENASNFGYVRFVVPQYVANYKALLIELIAHFDQAGEDPLQALQLTEHHEFPQQLPFMPTSNKMNEHPDVKSF